MKTINCKSFCDQLQEQITAQLEIISKEDKDFMIWVTKSKAIIKSCINELRVFVTQYKFTSKAEEIEFFKELKPVIISQYYYYEKLLNLKLNEPFGEVSIIREYYYNQMNSIRAFYNKNEEFYSYCMSGSTHLDELYFTIKLNSFLGPQIDSRFSTYYDNTLAIFLANRLIKEYLDEVLKNLDKNTKVSPLTWTTKKAYLVELIYALHEVEAVNNGKADIKQIANIFEDLFNIRLGNFYRQFTEIGIRKTGRTTFIDQLKVMLEKRLDGLI